MFSTRPQYEIEIVFNSDPVALLFQSQRDWGRNFIEELMTAPLRKRDELFRRFICYTIGTAYTKTKLVFNVEPDMSSFDAVDF